MDSKTNKENILEMICAAINDCDNSKMKQTSETLRAVLSCLEQMFNLKEE